MFSLRQRKDGSFYLTWDKERYPTNTLRGYWAWIGAKGAVSTEKSIRVNQEMGRLICDDDEGGTRTLILEE